MGMVEILPTPRSSCSIALAMLFFCLQSASSSGACAHVFWAICVCEEVQRCWRWSNKDLGLSLHQMLGLPELEKGSLLHCISMWVLTYGAVWIQDKKTSCSPLLFIFFSLSSLLYLFLTLAPTHIQQSLSFYKSLYWQLEIMTKTYIYFLMQQEPTHSGGLKVIL